MTAGRASRALPFRRAAAAATLALALAGTARAQDAFSPAGDPATAAADAGAPASAPDLTHASPGTTGLFPALGNEAKRYGRDSIALVAAPFSWGRTDWEKAAAFGVVLGGLLAADHAIDHQAQETRNSTTDSVSNATTQFGATGGFALSAALIVGGLAFQSPGVRDTGRDALEAAVLAGLLDAAVKKISGRERPSQSNGQTVFEPGSSNVSFASGHATVAFAVASVIAERSSGWVIPGLAWTAATLVGLDRINNHAHFASDVFAGAVLGTVTGRFLVRRHEQEATGGASIEVAPAGAGIAARIRF
ncbi:MAG TPA: phosphatase PAP2 family protein [Thermoanaerobaculia bacterium]|nr:phosphatase PAP2 family protein [Thermoanaerobaculia bacterium]